MVGNLLSDASIALRYLPAESREGSFYQLFATVRNAKSRGVKIRTSIAHVWASAWKNGKNKKNNPFNTLIWIGREEKQLKAHLGFVRRANGVEMTITGAEHKRAGGEIDGESLTFRTSAICQ